MRTNFWFGDADIEEVTLPEGSSTIGDLLAYLGKQAGFDFVDPRSHDLDASIEVTINGKDLPFYPDHLRTPLESEDSVVINVIPLGGG